MHGEAKESAEIGEEKEIVELSTVQTMGKDKFGIITQSGLQDALDINAGEEKAKALPNGENLVVKFLESNRYYEVDVKGTITGPIKVVVDKNPGDITVGINGEELKGTEASPYEIWCIEDLVAFSENQNTSGTYTNSVVKLGTTLDFNSILSYADYTTTKYDTYLGGEGTTELMTQLSQEGKGFIPIGKAGRPFNGIFDGQGFEIQNIYINVTADAGLFSNTSNATIKNLGITGEIISETYAGGIVCVSNENTKIENCYNKATINANDSNTIFSGTGGICGSMKGGKISNCYNLGNITGNAVEGGIVGYLEEGVIENAYNDSTIISNATKTYTGAGGIVGRIDTGNSSIINCYNTENAQIFSKNVSGGIVGHIDSRNTATANVKMVNCYNLSKIIGGKSGGIVGNVSTASVNSKCQTSIINCLNSGEIENYSDGSSYVGGIIGQIWQVNGTLDFYIENTVNVGKVSQNATAEGEIIGRKVSANTAQLNYCYYNIKNSNNAIGQGTVSGTISPVSIDENLCAELNTYVTNYNETNKGEEEFIELKKWNIDDTTLLINI